MKIKDILRKNKSGFALEFFPPKNSDGKGAFLEVVNDLKAFGPLYLSMTYGAGGTTQERTMNALGWIRSDNSLPLMSHLTGIGATRDSIGAIVDELEALGIDNILALRGDPPKNAPDLDAAKGEFPFARDLVEFLKKTGLFSLGVAVYPEGHPQSPSLAKDLEYTKRKIDAGADFAITQMFFENDHYYRFLERARKAGIRVPIIPGIMPILDCRRIREFATVCSATIPQAILDRIEPVADMPEEVRKLGVEFAVRQVSDLMNHGVKYFHFYTMNRADSVIAILHATGLARQRTPVAA
ncbi:MAG: methylenetetrahydrofolate reductase [NAD(P)H] [Nitrospirota bacterium]